MNEENGKVAALKRKLLTRAKPAGKPDLSKGLSTGSTMMNLASTGLPNVGLIPGVTIF